MSFLAFQRHLAVSLRAHRNAAGLPQTALATRAGVSAQWIGAIETAKGSPTLETLHRIAEALGLSVSALTWLPDERARPDDELSELVSHLRRLPPGAVGLTRDYVAGLAALYEATQGTPPR